MTAARTAFLVVRTSFTADDSAGPTPSLRDDVHYQPLDESDYGTVQVPEVVFLDRKAAERERNRRELAARELLNPFWLSDGFPLDLTSITEESFSSQLIRLGLKLPTTMRDQHGEYTDWAAWWEAGSPNWNAGQRDAVWNLLDKVQLFDVVKIELE